MEKSTIWRVFLAPLVTVLLITGGFSCSLFTGPKKGSNVDLSAADVISTEVWLKIGFADSPSGGDYEIKRDGSLVLAGSFNGTDTVVVDTTVEPSSSYMYEGYRMEEGRAVEQSSPVEVTTLDTTTNSFNCELYKFGDLAATGMSSELYGVAVINDTDIWAVGKIYTTDSVGMYNAVHWDGKEWKFYGMQFFTFCGQAPTNSYPAKAVFPLDSTEVLASSGSQVTHIQGDTQFNTECVPVSVNSIYAISSSDIYIAGAGGLVAHYDGKSWTRVASGTTEDLFDIYSGNGKDIYVAGGNLFTSASGVLLEGDASGFKIVAEGEAIQSGAQLFKPYFDGDLSTVWVSRNGTVYFAGNWLYRYTAGQIGFVRTLPGNYWGGNTNGQYWGALSQVRGISENDMVLVGERNTIRYFNGASWTQLGMPYNPNSDYTWLSVGMTPDMIVAVGFTINNAVIMMLKRE